MDSKIILFLGGLLSSLVVYMCIYNKPTEKAQHIKVIKQQKQPPVEKKILYKEPTLYYIDEYSSSAKLNFVDKSLGDKLKVISENNNQIANIIYSEDYKPARWSNLVLKMLKFFDLHKIKNYLIQANGNKIKIKANFKNKKLFNQYNQILRESKDKNLIVSNLSTLKEDIDLSKIQRDINKNLKLHPIYFAKSSSKITKEGIKNLDRIISTFLKYKDVRFDLIVEGHTDSTGNESKNKTLSKKRANSVKNYLLQNSYNLNSVKSLGYGSSKPKYRNSKNPKNRRVEIIVKKGKNYGNI